MIDKEIVRKFIEADCEKFSGLLKIYARLIEAKIPFTDSAERAQGMADAVEILQSGIDKAKIVADMVNTKQYDKLEKQMAEEHLTPYAKKVMN